MKSLGCSFKSGWRVWVAIGVTLVVFSCQSASLRNPPPMFKLEALAPRAAMLPVSANDSAVADLFSIQLTRCLEQRNALDFIPAHQVERALRENGIGSNQASELTAEQLRAITHALGIHYTIGGRLSLHSSASTDPMPPWITANIQIHEGPGGERIDSWEIKDAFPEDKTVHSLDDEKMAQIAANRMCSEMLESDYRPFALRDVDLFRRP